MARTRSRGRSALSSSIDSMPGLGQPRPPAGLLARVLEAEFDRNVAEGAVKRQLITLAQLAQAAEEAETNGVSVTKLLVDRGWLDPALLATLETQVAHEDFLRWKAFSTRNLPPEAQTAAGDPARQWAEFLLVALIGRGATSEVWKAWDRVLSRWVAIKVSTVFDASASARERFFREAVVAARLSHPHIVRIERIGLEKD